MITFRSFICFLIPVLVFGGDCVHEIASGKYVGDWKDGRREGYGCTIDANIHCGNYVKGKKSGKGKFYFHNGEIYEGNFENDTMSGNGTYYWRNGDKYIGTFNEDKPNGQGIKRYSNGDRYDGEFMNGNISGLGIYYWGNGDALVGNFLNEKANGEGTKTYASGDKYEGFFKNGDWHGEGSFTWNNGDRYEGNFENGKLSGQGVFYYKNGEICSGKIVGNICKGTKTTAAGKKIVGDFLWRFEDERNHVTIAQCGSSDCLVKNNNAERKTCTGQFPWMVKILTPNWKDELYHRCTGTIVSKDWIITAAHCFFSGRPGDVDPLENFHFQLGFTDTDKTQFIETKVTERMIHPQYVNDPDEEGYDIALLKLDKSLTFQNNVGPICLPNKDENFVGQNGTVAAWWKQITIPIISNERCQMLYQTLNPGVEIKESNLCAYEDNFKATQDFEGDSAAPLMVEKASGSLVLAGIVNYGPVCIGFISCKGSRVIPSVYASVPFLLDWINSTIG